MDTPKPIIEPYLITKDLKPENQNGTAWFDDVMVRPTVMNPIFV